MLFYAPNIWGQQWKDPSLHYPRFDQCRDQSTIDLPECFAQQMNLLVKEASKNWSSEVLTQEQVSVLFEVDKKGGFVVRYIDSPTEQMRDYVGDFFSSLPQIVPASYNGRDIYMQFSMRFSPIDLGDVQWSLDLAQSPTTPLETSPKNEVETKIQEPKIKSFTRSKVDEYGTVQQGKYQGNGYQSGVLIPLSHRRYDEFEAAMNQIVTNNHTAQKPYRFSEVQSYYDLKAADSSLKKPRKTWFGRKWSNEHMVAFTASDYWFT